eukprot:gene20113-biopygen1020
MPGPQPQTYGGPEGRGRIIRPGGLTGRWVSSPPGVWVHPKPLKGPPTMVTARSDLAHCHPSWSSGQFNVDHGHTGLHPWLTRITEGNRPHPRIPIRAPESGTATLTPISPPKGIGS